MKTLDDFNYDAFREEIETLSTDGLYQFRAWLKAQLRKPPSERRWTRGYLAEALYVLADHLEER
jgi:hypothetical protein